MTDDEKKRLRHEATDDHEKANEELAHLIVRAHKTAASLRAAADWISTKAEMKPSGADFQPTIEPVRVDPKYQEALDFNALLRLEEALKKARGDVVNTGNHKRMLDEGRSGTIKL
jgi:hypothetical protein